MTEQNNPEQHKQSVPPFRATILVADDDPHIREIVCFALNKEGYRTYEAGDGQQCLEIYRQHNPELVILDILMPEMDGTDVCRVIRENSSTPIIFLSSRDDEVDKIVGLELGGDDYITKPFSPREMLARVKAVLRRVHVTADPEKNSEESTVTHKKQHFGKLLINQERFQVLWDDREVRLTATEFALVVTLINTPGRVYSREELMDRAYDHGTLVTDRTIDSHIRKIRSKFRLAGGEPIETVHGVGYKLGRCI